MASPPTVDLVLSSGFLAFARQVGFLSAVEEAVARGRLQVDGLVGTSSGALAGCLWAAGWTAEEIAHELGAQRPIDMVALHWQPWRGLFSLDRVVARLAEVLPPRIEDLPRPFGVGVMDAQRRPAVLTSGPLPEAVAASCAMPWVFRPVQIDGRRYQDGGAVDRLGLAGWRAARGPVDVLVHLVSPSHGPPTASEELADLQVVHTPASGASFFSLGDFDSQQLEARQLALELLGRPATREAGPPVSP